MSILKRALGYLRELLLEPIPSPSVNADFVEIYGVGRAQFKGIEQWCLLSSDGWPMFGFGEDRQSAVRRAATLNEVASERIKREAEAREAERQAITQRRAALRLVTDEEGA